MIDIGYSWLKGREGNKISEWKCVLIYVAVVIVIVIIVVVVVFVFANPICMK